MAQKMCMYGSKTLTIPHTLLRYLQRFQAPAEEAGQWSIRKDNRGKTYYLNSVTGTTQYEKPDCLKKYDPRPSGSCVIM